MKLFFVGRYSINSEGSLLFVSQKVTPNKAEGKTIRKKEYAKVSREKKNTKRPSINLDEHRKINSCYLLTMPEL